MRIIPVFPQDDLDEESVTVGTTSAREATDATQRLSLRTLGRFSRSRRTLAKRTPSRRTFGRRGPSRRTFGRRAPSRRAFGRRMP